MKTKNNIVSIVGGFLSSAASLFFSGCGGVIYSEPCPVYAPPYPIMIYERDYLPPIFYFHSHPHREIMVAPPRHHPGSYPSHPFNNGPYRHSPERYPMRK